MLTVYRHARFWLRPFNPKVSCVHTVRRAPVLRQQRRSMATAVHAKLSSERAEQAQPQAQRTSDAELRADGLLMLAAAMMPLVLDVEPAAAGNPLLTGKTVCNTACCIRDRRANARRTTELLPACV